MPTDRLVTPGFVDIHTHLDAQLAWDPIGTSSCWHGVTSVVMGNCGVTFAPCRPDDRATLAEMMESVEDIPAEAILDGLAWDWETYGEYYDSIDRLPKGPNAGGLVGHSALRTYVMGERGLDEAPGRPATTSPRWPRLLDEAMAAGALGVSTSRTLHAQGARRSPGARGPTPPPTSCSRSPRCCREHGAGVFEGAMRLGERDNDAYDNSRAEVALMGEISRRSGRPVSFGLTQSNRRPDLYERVIEFVKAENAAGANVRPQTTARGVGILFGLETRTPFDRAPSWKELRGAVNGRKLQMVRDATFRQTLITEADVHGTPLDLDEVFVLPTGGARYDCDPGELARGDRRRAWRESGGRVHRTDPRDRRRARGQHAVPQPGSRCGRGDARRSAGHPRTRRCRCPRRPDHGRQPADVPAHATGCASVSAGASRRRCAGSPPTPPTCSASPIAGGSPPERSPTST